MMDCKHESISLYEANFGMFRLDGISAVCDNKECNKHFRFEEVVIQVHTKAQHEAREDEIKTLKETIEKKTKLLIKYRLRQL